MHPNAALLDRFYTAFAARDHATMAQCYAPDASFADPVFPDLEGWRIAAMWRMLCERGKDLEITFSDVQAGEHEGTARWEAHYTFAATRRKVHNRIQARFEFRDGLIVSHRDDFDLSAWLRMALGVPGTLVAWSPFLQRRFQARVSGELDKFVASRGIAPSATGAQAAS